MIDLVFWSFVVALSPIALSLGTKLIALIAGPLGPPNHHSLIIHGKTAHTPHYGVSRINQTGGSGRGY